MDIFIKALMAAIFATIAIIAVGQTGIKTNDLRNYPNLRPEPGRTNGTAGLADVARNSAAHSDPDAPKAMTQGQEEAAKSGFSTELENPNK